MFDLEEFTNKIEDRRLSRLFYVCHVKRVVHEGQHKWSANARRAVQGWKRKQWLGGQPRYFDTFEQVVQWMNETGRMIRGK